MLAMRQVTRGRLVKRVEPNSMADGHLRTCSTLFGLAFPAADVPFSTSCHRKVVSEALGHISCEFMLDPCSRVQESTSRKATDAIEEVFGGSAAEGVAGTCAWEPWRPFGGNEARRERKSGSFPQVACAAGGWPSGRRRRS
jgi:hypothetical protein